MISPVLISQQINDLIGSMVEIGLSSDQNYSHVVKRSGNYTEVTFPKSENVSIALKDLPYSEVYDVLDSERAFILKFPDGGLVLMRYLFHKSDLERHSLGYYPSPSLKEFQNSPEVYLEDIIFAEVTARNIVATPIRFDYDCRDKVHKPIDHPKSHFTIGQYQNCRIPVTAPLTPYWFLAFILRNFYNTAFMEYAARLPYYADKFTETCLPAEKGLIHIQIPIG